MPFRSASVGCANGGREKGHCIAVPRYPTPDPMHTTVTGLLPNQRLADRAAHNLVLAGFPEERVRGVHAGTLSRHEFIEATTVDGKRAVILGTTFGAIGGIVAGVAVGSVFGFFGQHRGRRSRRGGGWCRVGPDDRGIDEEATSERSWRTRSRPARCSSAPSPTARRRACCWTSSRRRRAAAGLHGRVVHRGSAPGELAVNGRCSTTACSFAFQAAFTGVE